MELLSRPRAIRLQGGGEVTDCGSGHYWGTSLVGIIKTHKVIKLAGRFVDPLLGGRPKRACHLNGHGSGQIKFRIYRIETVIYWPLIRHHDPILISSPRMLAMLSGPVAAFHNSCAQS